MPTPLEGLLLGTRKEWLLCAGVTGSPPQSLQLTGGLHENDPGSKNDKSIGNRPPHPTTPHPTPPHPPPHPTPKTPPPPPPPPKKPTQQPRWCQSPGPGPGFSSSKSTWPLTVSIAFSFLREPQAEPAAPPPPILFSVDVKRHRKESGKASSLGIPPNKRHTHMGVEQKVTATWDDHWKTTKVRYISHVGKKAAQVIWGPKGISIKPRICKLNMST